MPQSADCTVGIRLSDTGVLLEEYGAQVVERTVTTWVASESGKEFEIVFKANNYPSSLQLVIFVDGIELVNRGYDRERKMGREIVCKGISMDADTVKPFVFSDIVFPEEDSVFDHNGMGDVGAIRIEVLQVVFTESRHPKYIVPSLSNDPLHKCSCINGARGIRLGQQKVFRTKKMTSMPFDPANPGPVAIFKYIYRPRSMLLSQGIIPTYVPRFVEHLEQEHEPEPGPAVHLESPYSPSIRSIASVEPVTGPVLEPGTPRHEGREEAIRRLREQRDQIEREVRELEELRQLKQRQAQIQRELDELEHLGFE
ncbi:hypothetical protein ACEPAF_2053 [Sanghuangporus sanghuang]